MRLEYPEGATPFDEDYRQDLIPDLQLQAELNEFEQKNIVEAILWATKTKRLPHEIVAKAFLFNQTCRPASAAQYYFNNIIRFIGTTSSTSELTSSTRRETGGNELLRNFLSQNPYERQ